MKHKMLIVGFLVFVLGSGFAFQAGHNLHRDPAKMIVWLLDFKLDLSDAQEKAMKDLLAPVIADLKANRPQPAIPPEELLKKVADGKLLQADIIKIMESRRSFAQANQDKIADLIIKLYQVLNDSQRQQAASLMKARFDQFPPK